MCLLLVRIDDRLIHGQVIVGWGSYLRPDRIILCSDEVANTPWQKEIYASEDSGDIKISVLTVEETAQSLKEKSFGSEKLFLLVQSPKVLLDLIKKDVKFSSVNIGGMHFKKGKRQIAPFIFIDDEDQELFRQLKALNVELEGRDVPTSKKIDLAKAMGL